MKLLLDTCIWGGAADELRMRGHDVVWSGDWDEDPGDEEILTTALAQRRILVTLDKDFGELVVVRRGLCFEPGPASWKHAIPPSAALAKNDLAEIGHPSLLSATK